MPKLIEFNKKRAFALEFADIAAYLTVQKRISASGLQVVVQ
ncbi:hypothetical protein EV294_1011368 [Paenibacillus sp. BK033]|nr:hypothetical protein [Paenibacillus sp. BK720]TCN01907.1 hypothetical protein EV294_1011368 [Paenibacillus sp. BK033]